MLKKISPVFVAVVCLVWIALITGFYYLYHKPFSAEFAIRLIQGIWQWFCALIALTICGGLGRKLLQFESGNPVTNAFIQLALGFGASATLVLIIGVAGNIRITIPILTLISLILLRKQIILWGWDILHVRSIWKDSDRYEKVILSLIILMVSASLLIASAPALHYDALTYHLALPATYLLDGRITALPNLVRAGMSQLGEMFFVWVASLGGLISAAIAGLITGFVAMLALFSSLKQALNHRAAVIGIAALAAGTSIIDALSWAYIDWFCFVFGLAGLISLVEWVKTGKKRDIFLAGLFTGFGIACKMTAGVFAVGSLLFIIMLGIRQKQKYLNFAILYIAATILPMLPWLIKNFVGFGNPFYPYLSINGELIAGRAAMLQTLPAFGNWMDTIFLPFRATIVGLEGMAGYSHSIGPLLLILGIFAWLTDTSKGDHTKLLSVAKWIGVIGLVVWTAANQFNGILVQTRLYYVLFPTFVVLAATGYHALASLVIPRLNLKWLLSAFVLMVVILSAVQNVNAFIQTNALPYLSGSVSKQAFLEHNLGWYTAAMEKVKNLPDGEQTLLIYEPRGLYCQPACTPDELLDRWSHTLTLKNDPAGVLDAWRNDGFKYLLVYQSGIDFFMQGSDPNHKSVDLKLLEATLDPLSVVENFGGVYVLYNLN
jgi:hypothetical protein